MGAYGQAMPADVAMILASTDGAGVLYRGAEFAGAVAETPSAEAYFIEARDGAMVETPLDVQRVEHGRG